MKPYTVIENTKRQDTIVYKYPIDRFERHTQIIVAPGEEALFVKNGGIVDAFGPGMYYLDTNHSRFEKIKRYLFEGRTSEYHCSVYFVNKTHKMTMYWGTDSPMRVRDNTYKFAISVRAHGTYAVQIDNSSLFFTRLVGKESDTFTFDTVEENFRSAFVTKIKSQLTQHMNSMNMSILDMSATLDHNSELMLEKMRPVFAEYGIKLVAFYITDISIPEDDPNYEKINAAYADSAVRNIQGYTWQQEQNSSIMRDLANNPATAPFARERMQPAVNVSFGAMSDMLRPQPPASDVFCPSCGEKNPPDARYCSGCGAMLNGGTQRCPQCNSELSAGAKFCSRCGARIV